MTNYRYSLLIASSGWSFVYVVPSQMTHLVASITLNSARSCVMQGAFPTQGTVSSIPTILTWGGSIRPEDFLSFILLLVVIIVAVAIVVAVVLVVVAAIIGIVAVVVGVPSIIKLSFVITVTDPSILWGNPSIKTSISFSVFGTMFGHKTGVSLGSVFLLRLWVLAMVAACAFNVAVTLSATNCLMAA
uniref:Uncharacterized protein n=1 Tax=Tanacetum cinerariifolium TaxID=118510 RepID=A0A6L2KW20_TANCI|nr:hypothetical protein [Tanacetum cinerariifolium]